MGTYQQTNDEMQTDDEVVVGSQDESRAHQTVGSVAGDLMSTEHGSGNLVASGSTDMMRPRGASPRAGDPEGSHQRLLVKRPHSVNPNEGRCNSRASTLPELSSAEVEDREEIPDVQIPPLTQR